jgi:hypothetical protein
VIKKAVWIWRRKLDELGDWVKWHSLDYEQILREAREAVEEEKREKKAERGFFGFHREREPRREPKPKVEVEEKAEKPKPIPVEVEEEVEEAVKPEASLEEELKKLDSKLIERARKEAIFVLWASFDSRTLGSPESRWHVVNDERLYDMYREAGELGTRMVFEKSIGKLRKVMLAEKGGKYWYPLYKSFDDPKARDGAVKVILETYKECRDEIIMMRDKLRGEVWDALARTLRDATPFPIGDGRALILTDTLDVIIAKRRENEGYIRIEGKDGRIIGYKRLSEVLATLTKENTRIVRSYEMPLPRKVKRLVISPKSFPGVEDPGKIEIVVPQCLNCGEIMRDGFTDLPHVCSECNSPAKEHRLYEGKPR